jgi:hypothetical protein
MIIVLLFWILIFVICMITGISVFAGINMIQKANEGDIPLRPDEYFFAGFLTLSVLTGILSIFFPIGYKLLLLIILVSLVLSIINYKEILIFVKRTFTNQVRISKEDIVLFLFIFLFVLMSVAQKITWLDTQAYHAQNIQWINKYPVVPGLGNLHDRFAFNSMYFVISALFTFHVGDSVIFPLNGICYIVLVARLLACYRQYVEKAIYWKALLYALAVFVSLFIMLPNINTPSPDIICATCVIFIFIILLEKSNEKSLNDIPRFVLLNLLVFSCIVYKLSSLFLILTVFFFFDKELIKKSFLIFIIGSLICVPFLVRNYILSGYLIYPFPAIDIFNPDWKIPLKNVIETKSVIEAWAKIPVMPYPEVLSMKFSEWIGTWFSQLSSNSKLIIIGNILSFFTTIIMLVRKDYHLAKIQIVIIINLLFWFLKAPDPRFAYGFLFVGLSINCSYIVKIVTFPSFTRLTNFRTAMICLCFIIIIGRRIMVPVTTIQNASLLIFPAPFGTVETKEYSSNFQYKIPVDNQECFNTEIPCVTYPLNDVVMRGNELSTGFKVTDRTK